MSRKKCLCLTLRGLPCRNYSAQNSEKCWTHQSSNCNQILRKSITEKSAPKKSNKKTSKKLLLQKEQQQRKETEEKQRKIERKLQKEKLQKEEAKRRRDIQQQREEREKLLQLEKEKQRKTFEEKIKEDTRRRESEKLQERQQTIIAEKLTKERLAKMEKERVRYEEENKRSQAEEQRRLIAQEQKRRLEQEQSEREEQRKILEQEDQHKREQQRREEQRRRLAKEEERQREEQRRLEIEEQKDQHKREEQRRLEREKREEQLRLESEQRKREIQENLQQTLAKIEKEAEEKKRIREKEAKKKREEEVIRENEEKKKRDEEQKKREQQEERERQSQYQRNLAAIEDKRQQRLAEIEDKHQKRLAEIAKEDQLGKRWSELSAEAEKRREAERSQQTAEEKMLAFLNFYRTQKLFLGIYSAIMWEYNLNKSNVGNKRVLFLNDLHEGFREFLNQHFAFPIDQFLHDLFDSSGKCIDFFFETMQFYLLNSARNDNVNQGQDGIPRVLRQFANCLTQRKNECYKQYPFLRLHNVEIRRPSEAKFHISGIRGMTNLPIYHLINPTKRNISWDDIYRFFLPDLKVPGSFQQTKQYTSFFYHMIQTDSLGNKWKLPLFEVLFLGMLDGNIEQISFFYRRLLGNYWDYLSPELKTEYKTLQLSRESSFKKIAKQLQAVKSSNITLKTDPRTYFINIFRDMYDEFVITVTETNDLLFIADYGGFTRAVGVLFNDIYTVMRMLKSMFIYNDSSLLVCYFGGQHCENVQKYFLSLIPSCHQIARIGAEYNSFTTQPVLDLNGSNNHLWLTILDEISNSLQTKNPQSCTTQPLPPLPPLVPDFFARLRIFRKMNDGMLYQNATHQHKEQIYQLSHILFPNLTWCTLEMIYNFIDNSQVVIACHEANKQQVLGVVMFRKEADPDDDIFKNINTIYLVGVDPHYQKKGIARNLLKEILMFPGEWYLQVRVDNTPAFTLYQSLGFKIKKTLKGYYTNVNPPVDAYYMHRTVE